MKKYPEFREATEQEKQDAASRETSVCVWLAIAMVGHENAARIWEDPSDCEIAAVFELLSEWACAGSIEPGRYWWGESSVDVNYDKATFLG